MSRIKPPSLGSRSSFRKTTRRYAIEHSVGDSDFDNVYEGQFHGFPFYAEVTTDECDPTDPDCVVFIEEDEEVDQPAGMSDEMVQALRQGLARHADAAYRRWYREEGHEYYE